MARAVVVHGYSRMAFDLPRSPRSLRFTGSVRALSVAEEAKETPVALGRARPKAPPPPPAPELATEPPTT